MIVPALIARPIAHDAEGCGEADPVTTYDNSNRAKLIACLALNRRVVVEAEGTH